VPVFEAPWAFALLALPAAARWLFPARHETTAALRLPFFLDLARLSGRTPSPGAVVPRAGFIGLVVSTLAFVLIVLAAARPQRLEPPISHSESLRALFLAVDLSQSMETRDFRDAQGAQTDRLSAVKAVVDEFIARRAHDRIGLIVFGTGAFPQAPPTTDHAAVRSLLAASRIGMAGPQTAIGDAIGMAIKLCEKSTAPEKVLVLLTDGSDTASRVPATDAAALAKQRGIVIHTVGIGDPAAAGEDKVDLDLLQRIADTTGGRFFRAEDRAGLEDIYATLDRVTPEKVSRLEYQPRVELFQYPLAAAALLLAGYHAIAALLSRRGRPIPAEALRDAA